MLGLMNIVHKFLFGGWVYIVTFATCATKLNGLDSIKIPLTILCHTQMFVTHNISIIIQDILSCILVIFPYFALLTSITTFSLQKEKKS